MVVLSHRYRPYFAHFFILFFFLFKLFSIFFAHVSMLTRDILLDLCYYPSVRPSVTDQPACSACHCPLTVKHILISD